MRKLTIKGSPINEIIKIFQVLRYGFLRKKSLTTIEWCCSPENIKGLEVTKVNKEVWRKTAHKTKTFEIRFQHLIILKYLTVASYMGNQHFENRPERDQAEVK